jgi:hypothetical protein
VSCDPVACPLSESLPAPGAHISCFDRAFDKDLGRGGASALSRQLVRRRRREPSLADRCPGRRVPGARSLLRATRPRLLHLRQSHPQGDSLYRQTLSNPRAGPEQGSDRQFAVQRSLVHREPKNAVAGRKALNSCPAPTFPIGLNRAIAPATILPQGRTVPALKRKVRSWRRSRLPIRSSNSTATR